MSIAENSKKRKKSDICYVCEWQGCTKTVFDDLVLYLQHVKHHSLTTIKGLEPSSSIEIDCGWTGCYENSFKSCQSYVLHASYHAFHCKLMSWGDQALLELKEGTKTVSRVECHRDPGDRCVLPELPEEFVCLWQDCLTSYDDAEAFYRHVDTHAMDIMIPSLSKEVLKSTRFATCRWLMPSDATDLEPCNSSFHSKSHLKNHLRSHSQEKTIACSTCGIMFSDKSKFSDHILRQMQPDTNDLSFVCIICHTKFVTERLMKEHLKKHSNSIICNECGKASSCPAEHNKHYSFRHSNDRPFDCKFCESRFKSKVDLRRHIYTHNSGNSFKCPVESCSFESRCQASLTRHHKNVHQNQPLNVYECHECALTFSRGSNLTRHLVNEHGYQKSNSDLRYKYIPDPVSGKFRLSSFFHSHRSE